MAASERFNKCEAAGRADSNPPHPSAVLPRSTAAAAALLPHREPVFGKDGCAGFAVAAGGREAAAGEGAVVFNPLFHQVVHETPTPPLPVWGDGGWLSLGPLFGAM